MNLSTLPSFSTPFMVGHYGLVTSDIRIRTARKSSHQSSWLFDSLR
jgi:hypothetical protein